MARRITFTNAASRIAADRAANAAVNQHDDATTVAAVREPTISRVLAWWFVADNSGEGVAT